MWEYELHGKKSRDLILFNDRQHPLKPIHNVGKKEDFNFPVIVIAFENLTLQDENTKDDALITFKFQITYRKVFIFNIIYEKGGIRRKGCQWRVYGERPIHMNVSQLSYLFSEVIRMGTSF